MYLKECIAQSIKKYPSLYKDVNYEKSELKVLNHLFLVIGNGMEWFDGYLSCPKYIKKFGEWVAINKKYRQQRFNFKFSSDYFTKPLIKKECATLINKKIFFESEQTNRFLLSPYPIHEGFGSISFIPDNVRNDWLEGANKICQCALQYWATEKYYINNLCYQQIKRKNGNLSDFQNLRREQLKCLQKAQRRIDILLKLQKNDKIIYKNAHLI